MTDATDNTDAPVAIDDASVSEQRGSGTDATASEGSGTKRPGQARRKRRVGRTIAITASALVLVTAGGVAMLYEHLNGNIKGVPLFGGASGDAGKEKPDAFGRTPINVLVIGSDGRNTAADCKLGGDCGGGGQNADVEMVVHVSADRSNATVMSVPRDTMTNLPACKDPQSGATMSAHRDQINSTLQYGPGCTVAAVHQLTGIPIDHFMMVDFSGVVNMSDAVGGVPVCVDNNVYDPYSHLKLAKGTHTLKGVSALEFVRSRHGFGDGSDLGRTYGQHIYLSSMIRTLKSAGTLTNPGAMYGLADAATKALTVDNGLDSIPKLLGLANDLNKVPSDRITFTTMQNIPDPQDDSRVLVSPAAQNLFDAMANDQSLTTGTGDKSSAAAAATSKATSTPSPSPSSVPDSQIAVAVENGSGVTGRAADLAASLVDKGFSPSTSSGNAPSPASTTTLRYPAGKQAEAQTVARALHLPAAHLKQDSSVSGVTLVIGTDWTTGNAFPAPPSSSPVPADTAAATNNAHAQTADQSKACAQVSTFKTVSVNGVAMSPIQAFSDSPDVPVSAP
ncbi:LCP family protein [Streptantibioticus ferralitis]|uniref:LCP family protein n=1 Tax=Streptantibioticus ferralitis TaxID=236510 RepID=A0ABT5YX75_9ACTN|nr:LCP family protein [Streptantibioticus ferralitis]MDF2256145.1 LCP family protein [Streptantibioticus ferralitis]